MLFTSSLFLYKLLFMAALIIAESLFLSRLDQKPNYGVRMCLCTVFNFAFVAVFPVLSYDAVYCSFMFTSFFLLTVLTTKICYNINWKSCIFCTVAGYSIQHLASVFYDIVITFSGTYNAVQLYNNTSASNISAYHILIFIEVYALVYWVFYYFLGSKIKRNEDLTIKNFPLLMSFSLLVLVEIVLNAFVIYRKYENLDMVYYSIASLTNIICTISVLMMQFGLLLQKNLENELGIVYQMWHQEQKQFRISKETIDLINMKCHDMKHQLRTIREKGAIDQAALEEMEETITLYDSMVKTGNQAFDTILAEKSLYCRKNNIFIGYIIDGEKLSFMSDTDIYSLFGNLLDNAIETVITLEQDMRVIGITIKAEGELLSISSHNYYDGEICMVNGLPVTNSLDTNYHGFGVKSMVMIVERYGGNITFDAKDHVFNLNILLPIPEKTKSQKASRL